MGHVGHVGNVGQSPRSIGRLVWLILLLLPALSRGGVIWLSDARATDVKFAFTDRTATPNTTTVTPVYNSAGPTNFSSYIASYSQAQTTPTVSVSQNSSLQNANHILAAMSWSSNIVGLNTTQGYVGNTTLTWRFQATTPLKLTGNATFTGDFLFYGKARLKPDVGNEIFLNNGFNAPGTLDIPIAPGFWNVIVDVGNTTGSGQSGTAMTYNLDATLNEVPEPSCVAAGGFFAFAALFKRPRR